MKKIFFLILISYQITSFSQGFSGGFYVGAVTSQVDGDNLAGYNKFGATAGLYTSYKINKQFDANLYIGYIQKGAKYVDVNNIYNAYELRVNYIELPLTLHYKPNINKDLEPLSFAAGINTAILMVAKEDIGGGGFTEPYIPLNKVDLGVQAEVFWKFSDMFKVGVRFLYSVLPIREGSGNPNKGILNRGQYNNVLSLSMYGDL